MSEQPTGWRAVPPALLLSFIAATTWSLVRIIIMAGDLLGQLRSVPYRLIWTGEAIGSAALVLALVGTIELAQRFAGRARVGMQIAVAAVAIALAMDLVMGFAMLDKDIWEKRWVFKLYDYTSTIAWLGFPIGLTVAASTRDQRSFGAVAIAVTFLTWAPEPVRNELYGMLELTRNEQIYFDHGLRIVRFAVLGALAVMVARGTTSARPYAAANGFRLAGRAMWFPVIVALVVFFLTLVLMGAKSRDEGSASAMKFVMMAQPCVTTLAFALLGYGALRAAMSGVHELPRVPLVLGGGGALWIAGVWFAKLPLYYRTFYGDRDGMSRRELGELLQTMSLSLAVVAPIAIGLLATAVSGYAARRGDNDLQASAQMKGVGYVMLSFTSSALALWLVPKAKSESSLLMFMLFVVIAAIYATVLMARLFHDTAEALEREPGLPPASIVSERS